MPLCVSLNELPVSVSYLLDANEQIARTAFVSKTLTTCSQAYFPISQLVGQAM